tara:strand:- start:6955 stop:8148 length:1194 start_codon:yes stop_codon:yes gene_type:complete
MLLNRLNLFAATNIFTRLATVFGILIFLGYFSGLEASSAWIVLTTFIASINTLDGLLSQYFMRKFIVHKCSTYEILCFQNKVYGVAAVIFSLLFFILIKDAIAGSCLAGLYVFVKRLDSRARAFTNTEVVLRVESISNLLIFLALSVTILSEFFEYDWLGEVYLLVLCIAAVVRNVLLSRRAVCEAVLLAKNNGDGQFCQEHKIRDLIKIIVMSSSGALSINISLLMLNAMYGSGVECINLLLSYRVFMLVCEIASIPLVSRVPAITQMIAKWQWRDAEELFERNRRLSLAVLAGGFVSFIVVERLLENSLPVSLDFSETYILIIIALGWMVERVISYQVLFDLCHSDYSFGRILNYYIPMMLVVLAVVVSFSVPILFPLLVLFINVITLAAKRLCR